MKPSVSLVPGILLCLGLLAYSPCAGAQPTWGFVTGVVGSGLLLDDGSTVRLNAGTRIVRADGSAGTREDLSRQARVVVTYGTDGTVTELRVFPPRSTVEVYFSNVAPLRGSAGVVPVTVGSEVTSRSLALVRATYPRPWNWVEFRSGIRYDPHGAAGAPGAARFMVKDSFGDLIIERVLEAGETSALDLGLDNQVQDRLTLEVASAGEGPVQREWCLWLDPRGVVAPPPPPANTLSTRTSERLVEALVRALGERKIDRLAVADFSVARLPTDQFFPREVTDDLFSLLGRRFRMAGTLHRRLEVGAPLNDGDRAELGKLGAVFVLTGSISARADGTLLDAVIVQVDTGALIVSAAVRE